MVVRLTTTTATTTIDTPFEEVRLEKEQKWEVTLSLEESGKRRKFPTERNDVCFGKRDCHRLVLAGVTGRSMAIKKKKRGGQRLQVRQHLKHNKALVITTELLIGFRIKG